VAAPREHQGFQPRRFRIARDFRLGQGEQGVLRWFVGFPASRRHLRQLTRWWVGVISPPAPSPEPALMACGPGQGEVVAPGHPGDLVGDVGAADVQPHPDLIRPPAALRMESAARGTSAWHAARMLRLESVCDPSNKFKRIPDREAVRCPAFAVLSAEPLLEIVAPV
jgi:hypothetical protein